MGKVFKKKLILTLKVLKKLEITKKFYNENNIGILADLGCNDGKFSEFAASKNIQVVGFDFDLNALDRLYLKSKKII